MKIVTDYKNLTLSDFQKLSFLNAVIYENEKSKRKRKFLLVSVICILLIVVIYWSIDWILTTGKHLSSPPEAPFQTWEKIIVWSNSFAFWNFLLIIIFNIASAFSLLVIYLISCLLFVIFKLKVAKYKRSITLTEKSIRVYSKDQKTAKNFSNIVFKAISKTNKWIRIVFKGERTFFIVIPNTKESLRFIQSLIKNLSKKA